MKAYATRRQKWLAASTRKVTSVCVCARTHRSVQVRPQGGRGAGVREAKRQLRVYFSFSAASGFAWFSFCYYPMLFRFLFVLSVARAWQQQLCGCAPPPPCLPRRPGVFFFCFSCDSDGRLFCIPRRSDTESLWGSVS